MQKARPFSFSFSSPDNMNFYILLPLLATIIGAQKQDYTTPVPILKQINRHNEDGSYSYGYEAADGSYKIESKYPNGEVYGKYGYVDDQGKLREIEYGASRRGFEPAGNEITVPPPTLVNNYPVKALGPNEEDDGQYREDPSVYYKNENFNKGNQNPKYTQTYKPYYQSQNYQPQSIQTPSYQSSGFQNYQQPATYQQPESYQPRSFQPTFGFSNNPQPQTYNPPPPTYNNYNQFAGSPASNIDIYSGSYSVNYK